MALIRPSSLIAALSGSLASVTFAHTKNGPIAKRRPAKIHHHSPRALAARAAFSRHARYWQTITDADRTAWRHAAAATPTPNRLGLKRQLSGFALFMKYAQLWERNGWGIPAAPISLSQYPRITALTLDFSASGAYQVTMDVFLGVTYGQMLLFGARHVSSKTLQSWRSWKFIATYAVGPYTRDIKTAYTPVLGELAQGEQVPILAIFQGILTGPSVPFTAIATVAA